MAACDRTSRGSIAVAARHLPGAANGGSLLMRIRRLVVQKESTGGAARWAAGAAVLAVVVVLFALPSLPALANREEPTKTAAKPARTEIEVHVEQVDEPSM